MFLLDLYKNKRNAQLSIITTWVLVGLSCIAILFDYYDYGFFQRIVAGEISEEAIETHDFYRTTFYGIHILALVAAGIFFISWLHTIYKNLRRAGGLQSYNEHWTITAWFVPFMNLYVPYQIVEETYKNMQYVYKSEAEVKGCANIGWWWFFFIASHAGHRLSASMFKNADNLNGYLNSFIASIIAFMLSITGYILIIYVIKTMSAEEKNLADFILESQGVEEDTDFEPQV